MTSTTTPIKPFETKFERAFCAFLLVLSLFLLYLAWGYTAPVAYDPLGPRPYPMLILSLLSVCCLYLAVRPEIARIDFGYTPSLIKKLGLCTLFMLFYGILFELLGFPVATALMSFGVGKLFGGSNKACAIAGVAMGVGFYILFDRLLDVSLPLMGKF